MEIITGLCLPGYGFICRRDRGDGDAATDCRAAAGIHCSNRSAFLCASVPRRHGYADADVVLPRSETLLIAPYVARTRGFCPDNRIDLLSLACEYSKVASTGVSNLMRISPLSGTGTNSVPINLDRPNAPKGMLPQLKA